MSDKPNPAGEEAHRLAFVRNTATRMLRAVRSQRP